MSQIARTIGSSDEPNTPSIRLTHPGIPNESPALDLATHRLAPLPLAARASGGLATGVRASPRQAAGHARFCHRSGQRAE